MLKCNKTIWIIREALTQLTSNKLRFILTVVGIAVGTLLYFLFSVLAYSYIRSAYSEYEDFAENTLLVHGELSKEVYDRVDSFFDELPSTVFYNCESTDMKEFSVGGVSVSAAFLLSCTNGPCTSIAVERMSTDLVSRTHIVLGRDFEVADIESGEKVVVIPELAAKLLFPGEDAIGRKVSFFTGDGDVYAPAEYTVIGVYADTASENESLKRIMKTKPGDSTQLMLRLYAPLSALTESERECFARQSSVYYSKDIDALYAKSRAYFNGYEYVGLYTKQSHYRRINELNSNVNAFIAVVMIIIVIISGIGISNSMIFSVRERIPEIGIRKSFGADASDIVARFVFEGAITAIVGVVFAVLISVGILLGVKYYTDAQPSPLFTIHFSWTILVKTLCFALLEGIIGSIIPAVYAARIQIADAVRFD